MNKTIKKAVSNSLDNILGIPFYVLNDGFIRIIDYMGDDESIVQAARVSYGMGTKKLSEDKGLIRYLMKHKHTTPFEMCEIKFHLRVPMDCWRQWIRHRTANINEYSTRYSLAIESTQSTKPQEWRLQSINNKQGSSGFLDDVRGQKLTAKEHDFHNYARELYNEKISLGVARELARKDLPLCTYTEAYWKIDLHNLLHFLELRMDEKAQYEIREYARIIGNEIVSKWCPITWEAFLDYRVNSITYSKIELQLLKLLIKKNYSEAILLAEKQNWIKNNENQIVLNNNRERIEFEKKLIDLDLTAPWKKKHI